jgi:hypothetical protein
MAELVSPYRHFPAYGVGYSSEITQVKVVSAATIDITWTFNVGNNGTEARWGDQYFKLSQNLGGRRERKLVEYQPGDGITYDYFQEQFGVRSRITPSVPQAIGEEWRMTDYDLPVHYSIPHSLTLRLPGPLYGTTGRGGRNRELMAFWQEVARRSAFSYLDMDFGYYELDGDKNPVREILPTHRQGGIKILWEEDR